MRFRTKIILGVALIEMVLLAVLVGSAMKVLRDSNEAELERRVQLGGKLLAAAAKDAVIAQDLSTLDSLVVETLASGQIDFVRILDAGDRILAEGGSEALLARHFHAEANISQVTDGVFDLAVPVMAGGILHGEVRLGVSVAPLDVLLASARRWAAGIVGLEMLLVVILSSLLGVYLARQLVILRLASQRIAGGDFEHRVVVSGGDELAETALAFNLMAQQLGESNELLRSESSQRLKAQQQAEKAGSLLQEAVSSIAQGFTIYDENDRLVLCNEAYLKFYETSRDLIVPGQTFEQIVRRGAERGQYADAIGNIDEWVTRRVAKHLSANGEVIEQRLSDGRWLLIVEYRTPSGYIAGNRIDITELKRATEELRQREIRLQEHAEQLNAIFALSPDGFVSFDGERRVKYASPAFALLTGIGEDEVRGLDESAFSERLARDCIATARFAGIGTLRAAHKTGAGGTAPEECMPHESGEHRHVIEMAGAGRRVLEVGLREESAAATVTQILYLRDITRETEVDRLKSEFLSTAAHELRTPMASIYGFAELLIAQEFDEDDRRDFLNTIFRQAELMVAIINELLDIARIEARRGKDFVIEPVDLHELLDGVVSGFKAPDGRPSPRPAPAGGPLMVSADRGKLIQTVNNVLSNAYKYSPDGGAVEIDLIDARGEVPPRVGIRITDHGIGMTPEQLARVCERFYRADTSGNIPGTGLGMAIVKEIVELHGGTLEIDSKVGAGTTVTIWLAAAPA